jgi:hypothetical protein
VNDSGDAFGVARRPAREYRFTFIHRFLAEVVPLYGTEWQLGQGGFWFDYTAIFWLSHVV